MSHVMYLVIVKNARGDIYAPERDLSDMDRKTTVKDIADGQFGNNVFKVWEICEEGPICFDRTEDILREAGRWEDDDAPLTGQDLIDRMWDAMRARREDA